MLKLEKGTKLAGLTLRMRERERFFEPRLLKALTIAIVLHFGALSLFHVTPFYFSSTFIFPPIQVQSEQPLVQGISVLATPQWEEEFLPPPLQLIPPLDWISFSQESILAPSLPLDLHALEPLEERVWPKWEEPLILKLEEPRVQLFISGDLAKLSLVSIDPLLQEKQPVSFQESPLYVTYQVQLDEKTGEIFWYERTESSQNPSIDHLTEKILLNLQFSPLSPKELVEGTLHFVILSSLLE